MHRWLALALTVLLVVGPPATVGAADDGPAPADEERQVLEASAFVPPGGVLTATVTLAGEGAPRLEVAAQDAMPQASPEERPHCLSSTDEAVWVGAGSFRAEGVGATVPGPAERAPCEETANPGGFDTVFLATRGVEETVVEAWWTEKPAFHNFKITCTNDAVLASSHEGRPDLVRHIAPNGRCEVVTMRTDYWDPWKGTLDRSGTDGASYVEFRGPDGTP